ncbi:hypothetical protein [Neogemmobacter tilapiae]|uniref:DUF3576 domain-containing protein n=1 Tax=Neogemmobacter tilapiae TaxID=875041 RepID=A0A918TYS7_9RHOB|nr:hypothetical protein [Gemmobacter tilapiae]GHC62799.1 hypothetical protein GCM10007315_28710 [Gemmobacter tilapiae]
MRLTLPALLICATALSACGGFRDSRLNPLNWFGKAQPVATTLVDPTQQEDGRPLVQQVLDLTVEPIDGGAIVRAKGLPPTQGWWEAELVPMGEVDAEGTLTLAFRVIPPKTPQRTSTQFSREITVAHHLDSYELAKIRRIVVTAELNALSAGR